MRRWLKRTLWALAVVIGLPLLAVLLLYTFSDTGPGRRSIEALADFFTGGDVRIAGLDGSFPNAIRASHVELKDDDGVVWLILDDVSLEWSPWGFLSDDVAIASAHARHAKVVRLPVSHSTDTTPGMTRYTIGSAVIDQAEFAKAVTGQPFTLSLKASGHYTNTDDAQWVLSANRLGGEGHYRSNGRIDAQRIEATVIANEPANGFLAHLAGLPEIGAIAIDAKVSGPRAAEHVDATVQAGPATARAYGSLDLVNNSANLDVSAKSPAMAPRDDLRWQSLTFEGHVRGSFKRPEADGSLTVTGLSAFGAGAKTIAGQLSGSGGAVQFTGHADSLTIPGREPDVLSNAPVTFSAHAELGRDVPELTFTTRHPLLSIDGQMQLGDETTGKAQLKLHRIGPFAALGGVDLDGDANLAATVSLGSKGDSYTLNGTIDGAGSALLSRLLSHGTHIDAAVRRTDAGLFVDRAEIKGTVLTFSGHGTQNDKALDFTYTARVADMSRVAGTLTGNLSSTGNVTGGTDDFAITANANGVLATTGFEQSPVTLIVLAQHLPNAITGTVEAHGRFDAAPLHLSAALDPRGTGHHVALKTLEWRSVRANGDFTVPANFRAVSGHTEFHVAQLADIGLLIGQQLKGAINGTVDIASEGGRDVGRVHANASGLDIQGNRAEALAIDGSVINPFGKPVAALTLKGSGLALGSLHGSADAKVDGGLDALNVSLTGDFKTGADEIPLTAGATLDLDGGKATLAKFETRYRGEPLRLTAPAHITFKNGVSVDRLQLLSDHAEIFASGRITPTLALDAELRNASPDLIRIFVPSLDADGTLSGEAHLTGTLSAPGGTFSARADGFHLRGEASGLPPANVTASGTLRGQTMALTARIDAGERVHLSLDGSVPLQATRPFDLAANGTLDLAVLDPVLTANGRRVRGTVTLNGRFMGTFDDPRAAGTATLAKGSYEDFTQGVRVTNVAATFEAKGDTITISQLDGKAGHGTISGSGTIALWAPGIPLDLSITMKRARPVATDLFTADLNAELKLTGKLSERLQLSGTARIQQGEINIAESFPSDVAVLDVRRSRNAPAPPPPPKPLAIALDLTVTAPNQIYVRGRGLDAEMGGRLVVKGLSTAPLVNGGFTMRRGELNLGGATVKFTSGKITFDGRSLNGSFDPALDFAAENTSASVTAKLAITGHASAPIIALSSTPPQPQDEVLARLLFGQSVSQLSPLQLAQIAQSFAALGGVGGGFNPLGSLRKTLGLDRLAVGSAASGNGATIEVGKNFGRNVYVGAKQDTSGGTQAVVQIDLTRHLKLETTVTAVASAPSTIPTATPQENGSSVGLTYEFEY